MKPVISIVHVVIFEGDKLPTQFKVDFYDPEIITDSDHEVKPSLHAS